jgi:ABC-type branched-subunit amino acid transport system substrate-binding protein
MNVRARSLLAALAVALVAASCGGGGRDDDATATTGPNGEPGVAREASVAGVSEDAITLGILTSDVDKLTQLGYATDIGDPRSLYENFLVSMNASGGIDGRRIEWVYEEFDVAGGEASMQDACERLYDRATPFVVVTSAGFVDAMPCVTVEHDTPVLAAETFPASSFAASDGNLFTIPASSQVSVGAMVDRLAARGIFFGKTIGVLYGDRPGMVETLDTGLIPALERNGLSLAAKAQVTGASSDPATFAQFPDAIAKLRGAGVDTLVLLQDPFVSTNFMTSAAEAGYVPKVVGSDYQHIADATILPFIETYRAEEPFDSMLGVTYTRVGDDTSGKSQDPLDQGCSSRYEAARGPDAPDYGTQRWSQLVAICNQLDLVLRGVRAAGENPTRDAFRSALTQITRTHLGFGGDGGFGDGKQDAANEFRVVQYQASTHTFVPVDDYAPAAR